MSELKFKVGDLVMFTDDINGYNLRHITDTGGNINKAYYVKKASKGGSRSGQCVELDDPELATRSFCAGWFKHCKSQIIHQILSEL